MHAQYLAMVRSFFLGAFLCAWHDVGIATCRKCILSDLSGQGGVLVDTPGSACGTFSASFGSRKAPCNRAAIPSGGHIPIRPRFRVWPRSHSQELLLHITKFAVAHLREMASPMPRHKYHQAATWFVRPMRAPTACRPVIPRKLALQAPNFVPVAPRVEPSHRKVQLGALQVLQAVPEPQASTQLHLQHQTCFGALPKRGPQRGLWGGGGAKARALRSSSLRWAAALPELPQGQHESRTSPERPQRLGTKAPRRTSHPAPPGHTIQLCCLQPGAQLQAANAKPQRLGLSEATNRPSNRGRAASPDILHRPGLGSNPSCAGGGRAHRGPLSWCHQKAGSLG